MALPLIPAELSSRFHRLGHENEPPIASVLHLHDCVLPTAVMPLAFEGDEPLRLLDTPSLLAPESGYEPLHPPRDPAR